MLAISKLSLFYPAASIHHKSPRKGVAPAVESPAPVRQALNTSLPLPNELITLIINGLPTAQLARLRLVSRHTRSLVNRVLVKRYAPALPDLAFLHAGAEEKLHQAEEEHGADMRRYARFMATASLADISEASWYSRPPRELVVVCECLCLLSDLVPPRPAALSVDTTRFNGLHMADVEGAEEAAERAADGDVGMAAPTPPNSPELQELDANGNVAPHPETPTARMDWPTIRRTMGKYTFRRWISHLRVAADDIDMDIVARVSTIIAQDESITYEQLRLVSMPGYNLLIVVAAILQYVPLAKRMQHLKGAADELAESVHALKSFLAAVSEHANQLPVISSGSRAKRLS
jgi:hypothetical protein